jgi:hypothetical protein
MVTGCEKYRQFMLKYMYIFTYIGISEYTDVLRNPFSFQTWVDTVEKQ